MRIFLFVLFSLQCCTGYSQDLFNYSNSFAYARNLFDSRKYEAAAKEFERIVFLHPQADSSKILLLRSYRNYNPVTGLQRFDQLYDSSKSLMYGKEYIKLLWIKADLKKSEEAISYYPLDTNEKISARILQHVYSGNWKNAKKLYQANATTTALNSRPVLQNLLMQQSNESFKSPAVAGILSSIVPGTGKIYAGKWKDGIFSLVFCGVFAFQAYRAFHISGIESPRGWIFASLGTGFYLGNIYGSYHAAKQKNQLINKKYRDEMDAVLDTVF
ncbi:MAG: hypothetical protein IPO27_03995 [Bacteroidetes bacterium]|nr:hypothetical protein [Bacteroidota bacterium]